MRATAEYAENTAIAGKETSIPPDTRTSNTPMAKIHGTVAPRITEKKVCRLKNAGAAADMTATTSSKRAAR